MNSGVIHLLRGGGRGIPDRRNARGARGWGKAMTEQEWLGGTNVERMLSFLGDWCQDECGGNTRQENPVDGSDAFSRKARLFACACCRRVWPLIAGERSREAVEVAEWFADGGASCLDRVAAEAAAARADRGGRWGTDGRLEAATAALVAVGAEASNLQNIAVMLRSAVGPRKAAERAAQAALVRDIFGNPFRPVAVDPAWRTVSVMRLARTAYDERDLPSGHLAPARLAVLGDALEEVGCDSPALLGHLRASGPHVRGCWAVDLLLGKA